MTWRDYLWPEGNSPDKRRARHASGELITPSPPNGRLARSTSMARSSDALPNVRQHGTVLPMRHCRIRVQQQRNTYSLCETACDKPPPRGDIRCRTKKPTWQRIQRPWFCARSHHEGARHMIGSGSYLVNAQLRAATAHGYSAPVPADFKSTNCRREVRIPIAPGIGQD